MVLKLCQEAAYNSLERVVSYKIFKYFVKVQMEKMNTVIETVTNNNIVQKHNI